MDNERTKIVSINHYSILGVGEFCSHDDVKHAYRTMAKLYHPDVNPNNKSAEETFKRINAAYQILSDPVKRFEYDSVLHPIVSNPIPKSSGNASNDDYHISAYEASVLRYNESVRNYNKYADDIRKNNETIRKLREALDRKHAEVANKNKNSYTKKENKGATRSKTSENKNLVNYFHVAMMILFSIAAVGCASMGNYEGVSVCILVVFLNCVYIQ